MRALLEIYVAERPDTPGAWTVEAVDPEDGAIEQSIFIGPGSEQSARQYAEWKYGADDPGMPRVIPTNVERALVEVLGFRGKANPVELYDAIRAELERLQRVPTPPGA